MLFEHFPPSSDLPHEKPRSDRVLAHKLTKADAERLIAEIAWLKRRLHRVEHAIEPIVDGLRREE
jgi:hypothetical protein